MLRERALYAKIWPVLVSGVLYVLFGVALLFAPLIEGRGAHGAGRRADGAVLGPAVRCSRGGMWQGAGTAKA